MPINISLPQSLRGWNIGNVLIDKIVARNVSHDFKGAVNVRLAGGKRRITTDVQSANEDGTGTQPQPVESEVQQAYLFSLPVEWRLDPPLRFPLLRRYQRAIRLRLQTLPHQLMPSSTIGEGMVWLANLHDDTATTVRVGLYDGPDVKR